MRPAEAANCLGGDLFVYGNYVNELKLMLVLILMEVKCYKQNLKYLKTPSAMSEERLV